MLTYRPTGQCEFKYTINRSCVCNVGYYADFLRLSDKSTKVRFKMQITTEIAAGPR